MKKIWKILILVLLIAAALLVLLCQNRALQGESLLGLFPTPTPEPTPEPSPTPTPIVYVDAYAASSGEPVTLYNADFTEAEAVARGTLLTAEQDSDTEHGGVNYLKIELPDGGEGYAAADALADSADGAVLEQTLYVRVAANLYVEPDALELGALMEKETELSVLGFDTLNEDGSVRMYHVTDGENEGWLRPWYLTQSAEEAASVYDEENQNYHIEVGDRYGGGDAGELDYTPRDAAFTPNTEMPETCRTLYIPCYPDCINNIDSYIAVADECAVNAFVVDITDNTAIGYPSPLMEEMNPSNYENAYNSIEDYGAAVQALKDAGYYVIGRIATFHDDNLAWDHPEWAISDWNGNLKREAGGYWPSPFCREAWTYKLSLALEAVELFGFDEIQFDYVRFPDGTYDSEHNGTIDFKNAYGESKAQGIQRFLMFAADVLHERGVWVSGDVFGETSNAYVAPYGQYWPAMSNVLDAISAMPYPDHYNSEGSWNPWEHPYDILSIFGEGASYRQTECPTPAAVRTWIQCYDSIKSPKVYYYADNVGAEIRALYDHGLTGGFITWNAGGDWARYRDCEAAFDIDP